MNLESSSIQQRDHQSQRQPKKRNRPSFVCTNCKKKKIKCDRQKPCHNCVKAGISRYCEYPIPTLNHLFEESRDDQPSDPSLKSEVNDLKSQIVNLEKLLMNFQNKNDQQQQITPDSPNTPELFDKKLPSLKTFKVAMKPSRISFTGPLSLLTILNYNFNFRLFGSLAKFLDAERHAWKQMNGNPPYIQKLINADIKGDDLVGKIESLILPSCDAIFERLMYFGDHLNYLLYNDAIDMFHVLNCFHKYFQKIPINTTSSPNVQYVLAKPEKDFYYSQLSLIFSILECTLLFSKHDYNATFNYQLGPDVEEAISTLSTQCFSCALFYRKQNVSALMSLLIIKDVFFTFSAHGSDSMDETKSSHTIHDILDLSFTLGLHRPSVTGNIVRKGTAEGCYRMPAELAKTFLCTLQQMDATSSLHSGSPLLFNYQFCDRMSDDRSMQAKFTNLQIEAATLLNSVAPISLNELLSLRRKYIELNASLGTYKRLHDLPSYQVSGYDLNRIAQTISLKLKIAREVTTITSYIRNVCSDHNNFPTSDLTTENKNILKNFVEGCESEVIRIVLITWGFLKDFSSGATVFGKNTSFFSIYFKSDILQLLLVTVQLFTFFRLHILLESLGDMIKRHTMENTTGEDGSKENSSEGNSTPSTNSPLLLYDLESVELSLSGDLIQYNSDEMCDELEALFKKPKSLVSLLCEVHRSIVKVPAFTASYGYFCLLKITSICACFVDSVPKLEFTVDDSNRHNIDKIFSIAKQKLEEKMKLGFVDLGFDLEDNLTGIQHWLDELFNADSLLGAFGIPTVQPNPLMDPFRTPSTTAGFNDIPQNNNGVVPSFNNSTVPESQSQVPSSNPQAFDGNNNYQMFF
ncbi:unnamed protein product [Ambrosiozyma monospora]|uniref:Unnamed protein product n=1 Tax=Ambrosiozyma monospora TaxID=43982 RepID=A0ACB5SST0_AMBMO|nr:unnamed protein product [Ambrosiozyma monospora]